MKKILRLLVTKDCPRSCDGCCNKDWDLENLPVVKCFDDFDCDEILITGGEPLTDENVDKTIAIIEGINVLFPKKGRKVYVYTANPGWPKILHYCDGITLTLHNQRDVPSFIRWKHTLETYYEKSLRLNIFKGVTLPKDIILVKWEVKRDVEWIKDCPLPEDEVFMKMPNV